MTYAETIRSKAAAISRIERALAAYLEPWHIPEGDIHNAAVIALREAQSKPGRRREGAEGTERWP